MKPSFRLRLQYYSGKAASLLFGLRVTGSERVPRRGGLIIACNHISEMDPPVLGCSIPRPVAFMAKAELFGTALVRLLMKKLNAFPVNRSSIDTRAIRTAVDLLRRGEAVVIFPEGTRSHDGVLLPVKAGIGLIASSSRVPVVPAFIRGTDRVRGAIARRTPPFRVGFGMPIPASRMIQERKTSGNRAVAEMIMSAIAATGREAGLYDG